MTGIIPIVTYYQTGLLLSIALCLAVAAKAFQLRHRPGALWLALFMLAAAWWSLALLAEFTVTDIPTKIVWAKIEYLGSMSILIFLLFFALEFNDAQQFLKFTYWPLYLIMPVIILALTWTNDWHHLIWATFTPVNIPGSNSVLFGRGPLFWLVLGYAYLTLLVITLLFFRSALAYRHFHRRQAILMAAAILAPWLANIIYVSNLGPVPGMDFTPFGFVLAGILLALSITRWRFLELTPIIARDRLIEEMQDGVIVLDDSRRVIDINEAARQIFNRTLAIIGRSFPEQFPVLAGILDQPDTRHELEWPGPPSRILTVSGVELLNWRSQLTGYLVLCQDITAASQLREEVWQRRLTQAVLEEQKQLSNSLHAKTGQVLNQIVTLTQHASRLLEEEQFAAAAAILAQQIEIARGSEANIDGFIRHLPSSLDPPMDFFAALAQYIDHFCQTHPADVSLTYPTEPANNILSPLAQIQLLRMLQETLLHMTGVAPGLSAQIIISGSKDNVQIVVIGHGYSTNEAVLGPMLQSRVKSAGGQLELRTDAALNGYVIISLPRQQMTDTKTIANVRILLVDDQDIVLDSFAEMLTDHGLQVVGTASNGQTAIELASQLQPDVILMDIRLPGMSGLEATRQIKADFPLIKVIILTGSQDQKDLLESLRSGASGYMLKTLNPTRLINLLIGVINGDSPLAPEMVRQIMTDITRIEDTVPGVAMLSSHQLEVLRLVAQGFTYREVAGKLCLSQRTVQYHMDQIKDKLDVVSRAEVVTQAIRLGLVDAASLSDHRLNSLTGG